jgi:hypothetical protein
MVVKPPIELIVRPEPDGKTYGVCWRGGDGAQVIYQLGDLWLDLAPFAAARSLVEQGYDPDRMMIVHLEGADYLMMRAPLGAVAATPLVNTAKPAKHGALAAS